MSKEKTLSITPPVDRTPASPAPWRTLRDLALLFAPWAALLLIWSGVRLLGGQYAALVPAINDVAAQARDLFVSGELPAHWLASTLRVLAGVTVGVVLAIPVGFLLGWFPPVRRVMTPVLNFFRALPPIALIPLMIIYFGIGETAKVLVLIYSAFFTAVIVLYEGISSIPAIYLNVANTLGATQRELFVRVVIPLALPHILTATRVALGVSWMTLVAAELVSAQQGLGSMIQLAASYFQLDIIYLGLLLIGATAMLMDFLLVRLSRHLVGWQEKMK